MNKSEYQTLFEELVARFFPDDAISLKEIEDTTPPTLHVETAGLPLAKKRELEERLRNSHNFRSPSPKILFRRKPGSTPKPKVQNSTVKKRIPGVRQIIAVASGKGGVGKSTVSCNIATTLAYNGQRVGLLDADIYGPSLHMMLGMDGSLEMSEKGRLVPKENFGVKLVSFGFLTDTKEAVIWRGPVVSKAIQQFCFDVDWGELDTLVIDLPPGTGDVQLTLFEQLQIDSAVIVTTPQNVALLDAHKAMSMFERFQIPVAGVVENMSYYHCPHCGEEDDVFGEGGGEHFADDRSLTFLGKVPLNSLIRKQSDSGIPVVTNDLHLLDCFQTITKQF